MKTLASLIVFALLIGGGAASAQDTASLKTQMSPQTFKATGLNTLTPRQLARLEQWLHSHPQDAGRAHQAAQSHRNTPPSADRMGAAELARSEHRSTEPKSISSAVVGAFSGWHRGSIITLANGQKWKVVDDSSLYIPRTSHIEATVKRAFFGSHLLSVHGYNTSARVKRIQ